MKDRFDYTAAYLAGGNLTKQQAVESEQRLVDNPHDELSRVSLMAYHERRAIWHHEDKEKALAHELWFVRNFPEHPNLSFPTASMIACVDADLFEIGKAAWMEHVRDDCVDVRILSNAAQFFVMHERELAVQLLNRCRKLDPGNREYLRTLAHTYSLGLMGGYDDSWKHRAYEVQKELYELESGVNRALSGFATVAFELGDIETARAVSNKILAAKPALDAGCLHEAHTVLGRIYLKEGNLQAARAELLACGAWSEYDLDNEFISIGEWKVVCRHLWQSLLPLRIASIQHLLWIMQLSTGGRPKLCRWL